MASGHPKPDLGRIEHDPRFVRVECEVPVYATAYGQQCRALPRLGAVTKPQALRAARAHVAATGHTVTIRIEHWQRVHPKGA